MLIRFALSSVLSILMLANCSSTTPQTRERTDHWHSRNQIFEVELESTEKGGVVFLGNSITEGFDLDHWFPGADLINRGIGGDHLDGVIERLENSALGLEPEKIFIMMGINDIGDGRDNAYLEQMFTTLIDTLHGELPALEIYIHSILPTTERWSNCPPQQIREINRFLKQMARDKGLMYIDLHSRLLGDENYLDPQYTLDGLHLNEAGYEIWVDQVGQYLE